MDCGVNLYKAIKIKCEDEGEQSLRSLAFAFAKARPKFDKQILLESHRPQDKTPTTKW